MFIQTLGLFEGMITLGSLSTALLLQSPWLVVLLAIAVIPGFVGETHFASLNYAIQSRWTAQRRELDYLRYVAASNETAKEVQLFGLASWLIARFRALSDEFYEVAKKMAEDARAQLAINRKRLREVQAERARQQAAQEPHTNAG